MVKNTKKSKGCAQTDTNSICRHTCTLAQTHTHTHKLSSTSTRKWCVLYEQAKNQLWTYSDTHWIQFAHRHSHTLPLRHKAYIQGDFGCRATDGEATALVQPALSGSDSRLGRHSTLADQRPLMPTSLLPIILSLAPGLLTPPLELFNL